jgi:hypothetical protein
MSGLRKNISPVFSGLKCKGSKKPPMFSAFIILIYLLFNPEDGVFHRTIQRYIPQDKALNYQIKIYVLQDVTPFSLAVIFYIYSLS